jgi:Sulfotransferase family
MPLDVGPAREAESHASPELERSFFGGTSFPNSFPRRPSRGTPRDQPCPGAPHFVCHLRPLVVILCAPRSFSSVVSAMIGQHPQMYGFPELNLFVTDLIKELEAAEQFWSNRPPTPRWIYLGGLLRSLAQLNYGDQSISAIEKALVWLEARMEWSTGRVLDLLIDRIQPRIGVEKSVRTAMSRASLARARRRNARFLHLTRHPLSSVDSMTECPVSPGYQRSIQDLRSDSLRFWCFVHELIGEFAQTLPAYQIKRIRGEDLLNEPDKHLPMIAEWLGVRTDRAAIDSMKHPERSPYAKVHPGVSVDDANPKFLRNPELRNVVLPESLNALHEWVAEHDLVEKACELSCLLGYR